MCGWIARICLSVVFIACMAVWSSGPAHALTCSHTDTSDVESGGSADSPWFALTNLQNGDLFGGVCNVVPIDWSFRSVGPNVIWFAMNTFSDGSEGAPQGVKLWLPGSATFSLDADPVIRLDGVEQPLPPIDGTSHTFDYVTFDTAFSFSGSIT